MLDLKSVDAGYGTFQALFGVSLEVKAGEAVGVIGPNGAGKTTLMRVISGLIRPRAGTITMQGTNVLATPPYRIVGLGIAHVPENRRLFPRLTVEENLRMGAFIAWTGADVAKRREYVYGLFPRLAERRRQTAATMSGGEQAMLAMGRALMSRPKLLLLDEPSLGLSPLLVEQLFGMIRAINEAGTTVFLIEQNARKTLEVAHHGFLLQKGEIVGRGTARELAASEVVRHAYLRA